MLNDWAWLNARCRWTGARRRGIAIFYVRSVQSAAWNNADCRGICMVDCGAEEAAAVREGKGHSAQGLRDTMRRSFARAGRDSISYLQG